jgi:hypothetical protein
MDSSRLKLKSKLDTQLVSDPDNENKT